MSNTSFIGKIKNSRLPYFDSYSNSIRYKSRPVLILNVEKEEGACDFTYLPLSSISLSYNINSYYDVKVEREEYPLLNLSKDVSYIRTSKVSTLHSSSIALRDIADLKSCYPELWKVVIAKTKEFITKIS